MHPPKQKLDQGAARPEVLLHDIFLVLKVLSSRRRYRKWAQTAEAGLISYPNDILLTSLFEPRLAAEALV